MQDTKLHNEIKNKSIIIQGTLYNTCIMQGVKYGTKQILIELSG